MKHLIFLITSLAFSILFYDQDLGVNVVLFNLTCILALLILKRISLPTLQSKIVFISVITSGVFVIYHNTYPAILLHIINWFIFIGVLNYNKAKIIATWLYIGIANTVIGLINAIRSLSKSKSPSPNTRKLKLYIIPIGIIIIFFLIYRGANPVFDEFVSEILHVVFKPLEYINFEYLPIFILGLFISAPLFFEFQHAEIEAQDQSITDVLKRIRIKRRMPRFKMKGLSNEYHAGVFLLLTLNVLLAVVNLFDIYTVWIDFTYEGQTLKAFVHQGTYLLIFSIIISMGIVLYFFRNNLNFYKQNSRLKTLTYFWIIQNIVLTGSVFVRCYHYINHFGLAYKRIGVIVFLIAVIVGLIAIYNKVKHTKTVQYLWRINLLSVFILLNSLTFFNWDVIIAKYNIANYKKSYVHLIYLSKLSDSALFALQIPSEKLEYISSVQKEKFTFSSFEHSRLNISGEEYQNRIQSRIDSFKTKWENKHWLSWNYAEYKCYNLLNTEN